MVDEERKAYLDKEISKWPEWKKNYGSYDVSYLEMITRIDRLEIKR